jgi:hypothetical protein
MVRSRTLLAAGVLALTVSVVAAPHPAFAQKHPVVVEWQGISGPTGGVAEGPVNAFAWLRVQIPNPDRECTGSIKVPERSANGTWSIACPDGLTANGVYIGQGGTRGGTATGVDSRGRQVTLRVEPPPGSRPATPSTSGAATPPAPARKFASADEVRQWAHKNLVERIGGSKIIEGTGVGQSYVGKVDDYRAKAGAKVLYACIDWARSTATAVWYAGSSSVWQDHSAPRMNSMREQAETSCAKYVSKGCRCQQVDENNSNVLKVPDEFIRKVTRN